MARKLKIMENEKHPLDDLKNDEINKKRHPRSRGENAFRTPFKIQNLGSPPLTRGKLHSGKRAGCGQEDHPRSRGENKGGITSGELHIGSPPLTRGKRHGKAGFPWQRRITPAHAGKTGIGSGLYSLVRDHPRSRGENLDRMSRDVIDTGSPPLTRGKRKLP